MLVEYYVGALLDANFFNPELAIILLKLECHECALGLVWDIISSTVMIVMAFA